MIFLKAFLLAAVEGVTEFLPVSSTAHLVLLNALVSLSEDESFSDHFEIIIQFPAILAAAVYFRSDLSPFSSDLEQMRSALSLWAKALVAVIPVGVAGLLVEAYVETDLSSPAILAAMLFAGGVIIVLVERRERTSRVESVKDVSMKLALAIGLIQCLAIVPGVSRSGATIVGAMLLGADRPTAAKFSFVLAIPTLGAATLYSIVGNGRSYSSEELAVLGFGCLVSFGVGLAVVSALMRFIQTGSFTVFGYYRIALALVVMGLVLLGWVGSS